MTSTDIYIQLLRKKLKNTNKYYDIYCKMIELLSDRNPSDIQGEFHHIYPCCFCEGNKKFINDRNNQIKLTFREHFIVHRLLSKFVYIEVSDKRSMDAAVSCFNRNKKVRKLNSRQFEIAKKAASDAMKGKEFKNETRIKLSESRIGMGNFYDNNGNQYYIETSSNIINELGLFGNKKNFTTAKDLQGNTFNVHKDDPRFQTGEIVGIMKNKSTYVSCEGDKYTIDIDDPIIKEKNLIHVNKGRKFKKKEGSCKGEKNSMYGRINEICCFDLIDKIFIRIDKETFYSSNRYVGVNNKIAKTYRKNNI
jgi:hypothetical protein